MLASLRPAIRATRVPPIAAVREGAVLPPGRFARFRPVGAVLTAAVGFASLLYALLLAHGTTNVIVFMLVGALLIFIGVALFASQLVRSARRTRSAGRLPGSAARRACSLATTRGETRSGRPRRRLR